MNKNKYLNESDLLYEGICGFYHLTGGPFHYHRQVEIVYVKTGSITAFVGNDKFNLHKNQFVIIKPYELHTFKGNKGNRCVCPILPDLFSNRLMQINIENCVIEDKNEDVLQIFNMYPQFNCLSPSHRMFYFQMIFSLLEEHFLTPHEEEQKNSRILQYIKTNSSAPLTLESVAFALKTNRNIVSKVVNEQTHMNFSKYLNRIRLADFIDIYYKNPKNIADTAVLVGFDSPRTFYRAFKTEYGMNPKQYFNILNKKIESD